MTADNGWISVDERVPTKAQKGWMQVMDGGVRTPGLWHPDDGYWTGIPGYCALKLTGVTHWQVFAAPPKDPADEELEGILEKAMLDRQHWYVTVSGTMDECDAKRLKLLQDTITEIKAWRDKHEGEGA